MTTALLFVASVVLLVGAAELFTNAVEWAGFRMRLGSGATGSILAAVGTGLPETIVPIVALVTHAPSADEVATGSVLGAPFLLLALGGSITGLAVVFRRGARVLTVDPRQPRRDLGVFLGAFSVALIAIALPHPARIAVGVALLCVYASYVYVTVRSGVPNDDLPEPLHFVRWRPGHPHVGLVIVQLLVAIVLLVVASQLFVDALSNTAHALHIPPLVLALVAVPLATELPETTNSVLWIRSRDDALALGTVAGSSTFQSCILSFIGLVFTSWAPGATGLLGAGLTLITAVYLLIALRDGRTRGWVLLFAAVPWIAYVVAQFLTGARLLA